MKFYCDNCNTKYAIADEKVRGKVLKVRCKKCESVITVREQTAPAQTGSAQGKSAQGKSAQGKSAQGKSAQGKSAQGKSARTGPSSPPSPPKGSFDPNSVPWHYSLNGQSFGPFQFSALAKRFASGELGDECYVWTDSFSNWKPVNQVDVFTDVLVKSQRAKPRQNTIGVSQALEAVRPEEFERRQKQKKRAEQQRIEQREASPEQASPEQASPEQASPEQASPEQASPEQTSPEQASPDESSTLSADSSAAQPRDGRTSEKKKEKGQKDRLAKLRQRLKSESEPKEDSVEGSQPSEPDSSDDEDDEKFAADGGSRQVDATSSERSPSASADDSSLEDDALGPTLAVADAEPASHAGVDEDQADNSGLFHDFDAPAGAAGAQQADETGPSEPEESDQIPFLAGGPELSSESGKVADSKSDSGEGITGSLLIQLDNIQKQGRGKKALLVAVALLVVGGLAGTGIYISSDYQSDEPEPLATATPEKNDEESVTRTEGEDEQEQVLAPEEKVDEAGGEVADQEQAAGEDEAVEEEKKSEPQRMAQNTASPKPKEPVRGVEQKKKKNTELDDAFNKARKKGADKDSFQRGIDQGGVATTNFKSPIAQDSSALSAAAAIDSSRSDPIYKPTDSLNEREKASGGTKLTRKQINIGIKTVRRSVSLCRERHSRRGQPLEARKIYLTLTVEPSGNVSGFALAPKQVRHSEFERCMKSHRTRWKFPSFDGKAQKMRAPFVMQ